MEEPAESEKNFREPGSGWIKKIKITNIKKRIALLAIYPLFPIYALLRAFYNILLLKFYTKEILN
jgi:hypothetical protein